jgi:tetratricopeptide (TPR) repeat protein
LIDISLKQGRIEEVLQQYFELGEDFFQKSEYGKAAEKFSEGMRLGAKNQPPIRMTLKLQHRYAESLVKLNDFKRAFAAYQEIRQQYPDDERARLMTIDLSLRLGQISPALQDLDALSSLYQGRGQNRQVVSFLEGLVQSYPDESELHDRLAESYLKAGDQARAIEAFDVLGELQLSKGQRRAAAATIQKIIDMNPPQVEEYRLLLQQIGDTSTSR